jgi:hypothetical protein
VAARTKQALITAFTHAEREGLVPGVILNCNSVPTAPNRALTSEIGNQSWRYGTTGGALARGLLPRSHATIRTRCASSS